LKSHDNPIGLYANFVDCRHAPTVRVEHHDVSTV
jgi:hypothetical protein